MGKIDIQIHTPTNDKKVKQSPRLWQWINKKRFLKNICTVWIYCILKTYIFSFFKKKSSTSKHTHTLTHKRTQARTNTHTYTLHPQYISNQNVLTNYSKIRTNTLRQTYLQIQTIASTIPKHTLTKNMYTNAVAHTHKQTNK